jgi:atypical dual specificity phosphatase
MLTEQESIAFLPQVTTIQEKLDGANISFRTENGRVIVENRGKPVSQHPQFNRLKAWAADHAAALRDLNEHILYGEWLFATHGTSYDLLPDWFLAYDLYDTTSSTFLDSPTTRAFCDARGLATSVSISWTPPLTPVLLKSLAAARSAYSSTARREGLYLRTETNGICTGRAKLVRHGYQPRTDEDWKIRGLVRNTIAQ